MDEVREGTLFCIIYYQIKDYMRDHGSIGLFLGNGLFFLVGNLAQGISACSFSLFLFSVGEKVAGAQEFGR